jgi:O-antigen ligase
MDWEKLARFADWLVFALAMSLSWSTSATSILGVLWMLAVIPPLDWNDVRRDIMTPAGGLPAVLLRPRRHVVGRRSD